MAIARADLAVPLLVQAPPGQLTNVHDDLLGLLSSDGYDANADVAQFKAKADAARKEHNLEQLIVVELPRGKGKSVLSRSSVHVGEADRFLSPREKLSFKVDHTTLKTSDPRPYKENKHVEPLRSSLEKLVTEYIDDRYATGVTEVIAVPLPRTAVQVEDKMMEEAKTASAEDLEPADVTSAIGTGASEVAVADGQAESNEVKTDEDEVIDDPIQAVKDVESVEQEAEMKDSVASEEGEEKKTVDEDDQQQKSTTEDKAQAPAPLQEEDDEETQGETKLVIHIVANRYKLSNFWSGRWRATYTLSPDASKVEAVANVHIHYFEDGNVQLHSNRSHQLTVQPGASTDAYAKSVVKSIEEFEEGYQQELFKQCADLSEGAFRALRRQLPMTRQKIDWDKVLNYKLGNELSKQ